MDLAGSQTTPIRSGSYAVASETHVALKLYLKLRVEIAETWKYI
jgi:hypothetical protein